SERGVSGASHSFRSSLSFRSSAGSIYSSFLRQQGRQHASQVRSRAMEARFHGSKIRIHHPGNVFQLHLFVFCEDQSFTLEWRQRGDRLTHHRGTLLMVRIDRYVGQCIFFQPVESPCRPQSLQREVSDNAQKKGAQCPSVRLKSNPVAQKKYETVVNHILGS